MLYTEPRVIAHPQKLGFFDDYNQQEFADLRYGGQQSGLKKGMTRAPEDKNPDTIPAPQSPPGR